MDEHTGWEKMRRSKEEQHFEEENRRALARLIEKQKQEKTKPASGCVKEAGWREWLRSLFAG